MNIVAKITGHLPKRQLSVTYYKNLDKTNINIMKSNNAFKNKVSIIDPKHRHVSGPCASVLFTIIAMTISIIVIAVKLRENSHTTCGFNFKQSKIQYIGYDSEPQYIIVNDLNNDNQPDLVVANTGTDNIGILFGYADGSFTDMIPVSTGLYSQPYSVAIGDFNRDNYKDIAVANHGTHSIGLLFGYGNGSFTNQTIIYMNASRPLILVVEDMNKDNLLDIIVTNGGTSNVAILFGYPDGSFQLHATVHMGFDSNPYFLIVKDFNNDTNPDIAVVNYGTNNLGILLSHGNGNFTRYLYSTGLDSSPCSLIAGYFNQDNIIDIAVANSKDDSIGVFFGDRNGTFQNMIRYSTGVGSNPNALGIGDFDKDSFADIAVANPGNNNIMIFKGYPNGSFSNIMTYSTGSNTYPFSIVVDDFDHDNRSDIAVTNHYTGTILVLRLYGVFPTAKQTAYILAIGSQPFSLAVDDFNNDKNLDIVVANGFTDNVDIFLGFGNGSFKMSNSYSMPNNSNVYFVATGDFNSDKEIDIVVLFYGVFQIQFLLGYGNGSFRYDHLYTLQIESFPYSFAVADFNGDHAFDLATANYKEGFVGIFLGYGNETFVRAGRLLSNNSIYPKCVDVGDFNNDGIKDIITIDTLDNFRIFVLLGYGNGSFQDPIVTYIDKESIDCFIVVDINLDHKLDIMSVDTSYRAVNVIFGYGNGSFGNAKTYYVGFESKLRLIIYDGLAENDWSFLNTISNVYDSIIAAFLSINNGSFPQRTRYFTGAGNVPFTFALDDFNNDGQPDVVVSNAEYNNIQVYIINFAPSFAQETIYYTGSGPHPYSIFVSDITNDQKQEIIVAESFTNDVRILFNYNEQHFTDTMTVTTGYGSHPQYVTVTDFNHDNRLDIAVANTWSNNINVFTGIGNGSFNIPSTHGTGSGSYPTSIGVGDFNKDGWIDIAVTNQKLDNIGIFLGYQYSTYINQTIFIDGVLPKPYHIAVGNFNNDSYVDFVVANSDSNNINIYLGYGNDTFIKEGSYQTGQSSKPSFVVVGDLNNDKQNDIIVANYDSNSLSLFLGYGNGSFYNSIVPQFNQTYYPVSLALADFNNDNCLDIVVANPYLDQISLLFGHGNGSFDIAKSYSLSQGSTPTYVIVDDFNNDHLLDIAVANYNGNNINILLGYGNGSFENKDALSTGTNSAPYWIACGNLNNDSWIDIVVINQKGQNIGIFYGYGNGKFSLQKSLSTGHLSYLTSINIGKLNNDSFLDIAITDWSTGNAHVDIYFGFGDGTFTLPKTYALDFLSKPTAIAIADFNNDNLIDIAICNSNRNRIIMMYQSNSEPFATQTTYSTQLNSHPSSLKIDDFNHDTILDIVVANSYANNIGIFLGYGNGSFAPQEIYSLDNNSYPIFVATGDIDNDNKLDVIVVNSDGDNFNILFGYFNGSFNRLRSYSTGESSSPSALTVDDLNKDGYLDIAVTNYGINNVLIFVGMGNGNFSDPKVYPMKYDSNPQSISVGDFNNDNRTDIAVANYGTDSTEILEQTC